MPKVMTRDQREAFLAEVHIGVLSVADGDDRGPLSAPLWYDYDPGGAVTFVTGPESRKAQGIQATGRATLCVQSETAPYRYVTVEGPVEMGGPPDEAWRRALYHRYLGPELGDQVYDATTDALAEEVVCRLAPERWNSSDYSAEFGLS